MARGWGCEHCDDWSSQDTSDTVVISVLTEPEGAPGALGTECGQICSDRVVHMGPPLLSNLAGPW